MFDKLKEGKIFVGGIDMHYVSFGTGSIPLIMIPGLGDGLATVKGKGIVLWNSYRLFAKDYRVWIFSRKNQLEPGCTTRDMARDLAEALNKLQIGPAHVLGVSQGGMIAQWLAVDYPEKVIKLVLGISVSHTTETIKSVIQSWIDMCREKRYGDLTVDTMEKTFTDKYLKKWRPFYWLLRLYKPNVGERFVIQAESCLSHDARGQLIQLSMPVLVIGGGQDRVTGAGSVEELAGEIPHSKVIVFPELGHGAFEESREFNLEIMKFLVS